MKKDQTYTRLIHEILEEVKNASSQKEKVELLKQYNCRALRDVLHGTYDERIKFLVPEPPIPYTKGSESSPPTDLRRQSKIVFPKLIDPRVQQGKREEIFIRMLEGIHPKDANVVEQMIKKEPFEGITKQTVRKAFPQFFLEKKE